MDLSSLPPINATLNGLSFLLQVSGYIAIRTGRRSLHRALMLSAVTVSAIFLTSYLYLHAHVGRIPFGGQGLARVAYFSILISHSILAACTLPLMITTVTLTLRGSVKHPKWGRVTILVWGYVSITGVIVFLMMLPYYPRAFSPG
jgi:putative membrane protein